jgi:exonuclease VII large subunit
VLARSICALGIPVWTGLGHERDTTVLDEVAHRSFDTPSKVAAGIEQAIQLRADEAKTYYAQSLRHAASLSSAVRASLERHLSAVRTGAHRQTTFAQQNSMKLKEALRFGASRILSRSEALSREALNQTDRHANRIVSMGRGRIPAFLSDIHSTSSKTLIEAHTRSRAHHDFVLKRTTRNLSNALAAIEKDRSVLDSATVRHLLVARQESKVELQSLIHDSHQAVRVAALTSKQEITDISRTSRDWPPTARLRVFDKFVDLRSETARSLSMVRQSVATRLDSVYQISETATKRSRETVKRHMDDASRTARQQIALARHESGAQFQAVAGLGPSRTLNRGFAIVRDRSGSTITSSKDARQRNDLEVEFRDGRVTVNTADLERDQSYE